MNTQWRDVTPAPATRFSWNRSRLAQMTFQHDWSATPLGPISAWPGALAASVQMMLCQRHAMCLFWGPDLTMLYNDAYAPVLGGKEAGALGRPFREIWSDVWADVHPMVVQALSGESTFSSEMPLTMTRNGYPEQTYWTFSYSPLFDDEGLVAGLLCVTVDMTQLVVSRQNQQVMQAELLHRIRNILTVTSTVVSATLRNATTLSEARDRVAARIMALAKAQGLMTELGDRADIGHVVRQSISAHVDDWTRIELGGPALALTSQQAVGLSLALYELATNATKYGALGHPDGRIRIAWQGEPQGGFGFDWHEAGGPAVTEPTRHGFGSRLTTAIVPAYFGGTASTSLMPEGLRYRLEGRLAL